MSGRTGRRDLDEREIVMNHEKMNIVSSLDSAAQIRYRVMRTGLPVSFTIQWHGSKVIKDYAGFMVLSNHDSPLRIEIGDRRIVRFDVSSRCKGNTVYFKPKFWNIPIHQM